MNYLRKIVTGFAAHTAATLALLCCLSGAALYAQQPDLTVSNILAPATGKPDEAVTIKWTTSNTGNATTTGFFMDGVYLSRDLVLNTSNDIYIGGCFHFNPIGAGGSEQDSATGLLPSDTVGTFYIFVMTDDGDIIAESNESNNSAHAPNIITITNTKPDLRVTQVSVPGTASSSHSINVTYTVENQGTAALVRSSIYDLFVLSTDTLFDNNDQVIGSTLVDTALEIGGSYTVTGSAYLPSSLSGVYYVLVKTNYLGLVPELNLDNNVNHSSAIAIDLYRPDLVVSQVTAPALLHNGEPAHYSYTIRNIGDTSTQNQSWSDFIYLSKDTLKDDSDIFIGIHTHTDNLNAGGSVAVNDSFSLPYGLENGTYYLLVIADAINSINESNETNNTGVSGPMSYLYTGPDFVITSVDVPSSISSGSDLDVHYTIRNSGNQPSPAVQRIDGIYLSLDSAFDFTDTYLGTGTDANSIGAGQSVVRTATVTLPLKLSGTYYIIVYADFFNSVAEYSELNNVGISPPMQINLGNGPDLVVSSVTVPPSINTGEQFTVSWEVTNSGSGSTGSADWYDALYLSGDTLYGNDWFLGSFTNAAALGAAQNYTNSTQIMVPNGYTGDCRIIVVTNAAHQLAELNINNNSRYSAPMHITGCNGPDLVATKLNFPTNAQTGQAIEITWQVHNSGNRATTVPVWSDHLRLSVDTSLSQTWILGNFDNPTYLGPGESYSQTQTVTIPAQLNGNYYVVLDVNQSGTQIECNTANNRWLAPSPIQIALTPPPDLQVASIIAPTNAFSRDTVNLRYTVRNTGAGTAAGRWDDYVYITQDTSLDITQAKYVGSFEHIGSLLPESTYTTDLKITLPEETSGQYYFLVYTDRFHEIYEYLWADNNVSRSSPITITLSPPPDLVVNQIGISPSAYSSKRTGLNWIVKNQGAGETGSHVWYDGVYISTSASYDSASARLIGSFYHEGTLQPDSIYLTADSVTLPNGISGPYYVYIKTDIRNNVFEHTYENNNISRSTGTIDVILSPWPDLQVTQITVPPAATAGGQIIVSYTAGNQSKLAPASPDWSDRIYISSSDAWNPGTATFLTEIRHRGELPAGSTYSVDQAVTFPDQLSGTLYIYVFADASNSVYEHTDEGNNVGRSSAILTGAYPSADLVADSILAPVSAIVGQPLNVQFTVRNTGGGRTAASLWEDVLYLSVDTVLNPAADVFLARVEHREILHPGEFYTKNLNLTVPNLTTGSYYLLVKTDETGSVNDGNTANNIGHSPVQTIISVLPPPDLVPVSCDFASPVLAGQPLQVTWTVKNQGAGGTFQSSWYDGIYLSTDQALDTLDLRLGSFNRQSPLPAGESYTETLTVNIPIYVSGDNFILLKTDVRNDVGEVDLEINNVLAQPASITQPPPGDLVVSSVTIPPNAVPGEDVTISWVTRNQGPNPVQGTITDAVYISADTSWDINDPLLGVTKRDISLSPGASLTSRLKVNMGRTFASDSTSEITDILPGVSVGNYYVIVRTDVRNNIHETDETNNTGSSVNQLSVDVPELVIGSPSSDSLSMDQRKYYRVNVSAGLDLRLRLTSDLSSTSNEIYVAFGHTPTPSDFDFTATEAFQANHEIIIPSTQSGSYYILILARNVPGYVNEHYSISADALPFSVLGISPPEGGRGGKVTCLIDGAGFRDTTQFYLEDASAGRINGEVMKRVSSTQVFVRFNLGTANYGQYSVVAANGTVTRSLFNAFTVAVPVIDRLQHAIYSPYSSRGLLIGRPASYDITISNENNNDYDLVLLTLLVPADQDFSLQTGDFVARPGPLGLPDTVKLPNAGVQINSDWAAMTVLAKNVRAGQILRARMNMKKVVSSCLSCGEQLPVVVDVRGVSYGEFLAFEQDWMGQIREEILKLDPATVPPFVLAFIQNPNWQSELEQGYRDVGLLDERPIVSRTLPLVYVPNDSTSWKYGQALMEFASGGARSLCSKLLNVGQSMFTLYGLANAFMALSIGAEASFFAGILVVGGPVGWVILAASAALLVYNLYKLNEGGDMLAAKVFCRKLIASLDPNDIIGPPGYGDRKWLGITQTQPYTIRFENDPTLASAPAQVISVRQKLDSTADARSFRLGRFGFANMTLEIPENRSSYSARIDARDSLGIYVDISAGLDMAKNEVFWIMRSIDPATQQIPLDPAKGLLPVNDSANRGQGFVSYTIRASGSAHTGDSLRANATIVFDINPAINTPTIANTIDAGVPHSSVSLLPSVTGNTSFLVRWNGSDDPAGSGLSSFSVYVSVNDSVFVPWLTDIADTSAMFNGIFGNRYAFYSLAKDNAGNAEPSKASADASTMITGVRENLKERPTKFALHQNYPNPFNPVTTIQYDLPGDARVSLKIYNILGQVVATLIDELQPAGFRSAIWTGINAASGVYFYRLEAISVSDPSRTFSQVRKMLLLK